MKTILLCGYFAQENESKIQKKAIKPVEYSSNNYLRKLIKGFKNINTDLYILSAPLIGSFPNASKILRFNKKNYEQNECNYVNFFNLWGIRNFSRAFALKQSLKMLFKKYPNEDFNIVVCSVHTPFVEAACYAKKIEPNTRCCLIIPDLPQYMNLNSHISLLYRIAKKYDIKRFNKYNLKMDSYVLLTEQMKEKLNIDNKKYIVSEGLIDRENFQIQVNNHNDFKEILIVYTGKVNSKFGIKILVDAFEFIPYKNYKLIICGSGDCSEYVINKSIRDDRIKYMGQVSPKESQKWIKSAKVLVNPRQNNDEYTKYSFPSKNLEYLSSGNNVVLYLLDGMKDVYKEFCYIPSNNTAKELAKTIIEAASTTNNDKYAKFLKYSESLFATHVCDNIIRMLTEKDF